MGMRMRKRHQHPQELLSSVSKSVNEPRGGNVIYNLSSHMGKLEDINYSRNKQKQNTFIKSENQVYVMRLVQLESEYVSQS